MSNPKRVWDSEKRAVRQDKQQVWLVDGEKKVNTNHGFADATGTDVVYDSSWKQAQEPLQIYDNRWEDINPTPPTPTSNVRINRELTPIWGRCGYMFAIYANVDNIESASLSYSSSNENIYIDSGSIEPEGEGYNLMVYINCYNPNEGTVTITDETTGDSDSISLNFIQFEVWQNPVYVNRETYTQYRYLTGQGVLGEVEAWVDDDSIARIVRMEQPNEDGYGGVFLEGLTENSTVLHVRPHNYPELEVTNSITVTQYVPVSEISNLSTASATVFDYDENFASFHYTPTNASNPLENITIQLKEGSTDNFSLYMSQFDNGVVYLTESSGATLETGSQSTFQIINNNDQSNILEITLTKGENVDAITLSSNDATVQIEQTTTVSFTYTPTDGDVNSLYVQGSGMDYCSVSISGTNGNGTITITGTNVGSGGFDIYKKGDGNTLGYVSVTVTPIYVQSISQGLTTQSVALGQQELYQIPINPSPVSNAGNDISLSIDNRDIAQYWWSDTRLGQVYIYGASEGATQFHYYLNSAPETVYTVDVTVTSAS